MTLHKDFYAALLLFLESGNEIEFSREYRKVTRRTVEEDTLSAAEFLYELINHRKLEEAAGIAQALRDALPENPQPALALAHVHRLAGDYRSASRFYEEVQRIDSEAFTTEAILGHAFCEGKLRNTQKATLLYKMAYERGGLEADSLSKLHHQMQLSCDWESEREYWRKIENLVGEAVPAADPFAAQAATGDPRLLRRISELYATRIGLPLLKLPHRVSGRQSCNRFRLGFLSGEFRAQATSFLIVGLVETLKKRGYQLFFIDNGFNDRSIVRRRLEKCGTFVDISRMDDDSATRAVSDLRLNFLFNLNGYFGRHRTSLFARRLAETQINFLGFPGTLGSQQFDFIIADSILIPYGDEIYYSEIPLRLKETYQPNDWLSAEDKKAIAERKLKKSDQITYGCFNNTYKISESSIRTWSRILKSVDSSNLILLHDNSGASERIIRAFKDFGIDPSRVAFLPRASREIHLDRHNRMDLFLDTYPMGAHTTASDALRRGVPVLTRPGDSFSSRVAKSLLNAANLHWFVSHSEEEYVEKAISFGLDKATREDCFGLFTDNLVGSAVFDPDRYAEDFCALLRTTKKQKGPQS